jgi:hypothetical protein
MLPCLFKKHLGVDCPGCGLQRSFLELVDGNLEESLILYPALIPSVLTLLILAVYLITNKKFLLKPLVGMFILNAVIITINYVIKMTILTQKI